MEKELNPFQPGAGLTPPELTGREEQIQAFDLLLARTRHRQLGRGMMLFGLRGVGKTVLLRTLQRQAERMGWVTVAIEGSTSKASKSQIRVQLATNLAVATRNVLSNAKNPIVEKALQSLSSLSLTLGFAGASIVLKSEPSKAAPPTGLLDIDFRQAMVDLATALNALPNPAGIGIFIDEIQDLDRELLEILLSTQHEAGQRDLPFYLIGAGLPSVPSRLGEIKTYAERLFTFDEIGPLRPEAARRALEMPFSKPGGKLSEEAIELTLQESDGYPYFIQQFGSAIWDVATQPEVSLSDAKTGIKIGRSKLDFGFYRTRWDRSTESEQEYLHAVSLHLDAVGMAKTKNVASELGKPSSSLSSLRESTIEKGLIYSPGYGKLAFTVPGMDKYILRQMEEG